MRWLVACVLGMTIVVAAGCNRLKSKSAVQAAIEQHLKERPGLAMENMTLQVENVKFAGDTAEARVKFQSKQMPQSFVEIRYTLRRSGDHWEVESSSPMSMGSPHGSMIPTPSGTAPAGPQPEPSH
ncbi:MAG TPA: hypothetical protein VG204_00450 [Terriglobia bacterium]|nr:hypothetical protein [Terriglobia bacterium]